ncbi:MAG: hypothetical protein V4574_02945 [Pseudomonadota bacterium]
MHHHIAFGLKWDSDIALEQFARGDFDGPADVTVRRTAGPLPPREEQRAMDNAILCTDGVRFSAGDEAVFDLYTPGRVDWLPGPGWTGRLPVQFYGTLAALLLAWRGGVPIHGSSVEIDGRAWLICGDSGAGKSTLAAALIASGAARLIADDLSTLEAGPGGAPFLYPGRPAIRLFPALADLMAEAGSEVRDDPGNDKRLVLPRRADPLAAIPLAATIVLGNDVESMPKWRRSAFLDTQIFRPRWMWAIPGWRERFGLLHYAGTSLPMLSLGAADIRDGRAFRARAADALSRLQS